MNTLALPKHETPLHRELKRIELLNNVGLKIVEIFNYLLGTNLAPSKRSSRPCTAIRLLVTFLITYVAVSEMNFIRVYRNESFTEYSEAMILVCQLFMGLTKVYYYFFNINEVRSLIQITQTGSVLYDLEIFDLDIPNKVALSRGIGKVLLENWHNINRQMRFFLRIVMMPVFCYIVRPYFQYVFDCYLKKLDKCEMTLTYPAMVPFWTSGNHEYPSYIARFFLLQLGPIFCGGTALAFNSVYIVTTLYEVGLIRVLRFLVQQATNDERVPKRFRDEYLKGCVKLYVRIIRHHYHIEAIFKYIILVQCGMSCLLICMLLYKASMSLNLEPAVLGMIVAYLLAILLEICLYTFDAQQVATESEELRFDWYDCAWYDESPQFKFTIQMMILFGNRTFDLSVGGFTTMSLKLLLVVLRMSGNFFLLLRNVNACD